MNDKERQIFLDLKTRMDALELELRNTQGQLQFEQFGNSNIKTRVTTLEVRTRYVRRPIPHVTARVYQIRNMPKGYNWMGYSLT